MDGQGAFKTPGWGRSTPGGEMSWAGAHLVCAGSRGQLGTTGARYGQVGRGMSWKGQRG